MVHLPQPFPAPVETAVVTYDFTDFSDGTGIVEYNGFAYENSGAATVYALSRSTNTEFSTLIEQADLIPATGSFTKLADLDFDAPVFNTPKILKGTSQLNICHVGASGGNDITTFILAKIRKWDGTTETEVVSGQSPDITTSTSTIKKVQTVEMVVPSTHFKKGDTLRLTIEVWAKQVGGAGQLTTIGHDPENRDATRIIPSTDDPRTTTKLLFRAPFDLDV